MKVVYVRVIMPIEGKVQLSSAPVSHLCEFSIVGGGGCLFAKVYLEKHFCLHTSRGCQVALKGALEGLDVNHY